MHFLDTFFFGTTLGVRGQVSGVRNYTILLTALFASRLTCPSCLSCLTCLTSPYFYCNNKQ